MAFGTVKITMNSDETVMGHPPAPAPPAAYQPVINADETVAGYPPALVPPAEYPPPMPWPASYTQTDLANSVLAYGYPLPAYAHPTAGHGYADPSPPAVYGPPMPEAAPFPQTAYLPNAAPTHGYPPSAYVRPPAGHRYKALAWRVGKFMQKVMGRVAVDSITTVVESVINDPGSDDGFSSDDAWC